MQLKSCPCRPVTHRKKMLRKATKNNRRGACRKRYQMKFIGEVKELLVKHIEIEAVDKETAQELLLRFYNNGAIVLDAEDFQEVEISVRGKK